MVGRYSVKPGPAGVLHRTSLRSGKGGKPHLFRIFDVGIDMGVISVEDRARRERLLLACFAKADCMETAIEWARKAEAFIEAGEEEGPQHSVGLDQLEGETVQVITGSVDPKMTVDPEQIPKGVAKHAPDPAPKPAKSGKKIDDARLIEMWNAGVPAQEIADAFGVTKSGVVQRRRALGLPKRGDYGRKAAKPPRKTVADPAPAGPHDPVGCRFIHGDPRKGDWRYCQAPRLEGSDYCPEHHKITHRPEGFGDKKEIWQADRIGAREGAR